MRTADQILLEMANAELTEKGVNPLIVEFLLGRCQVPAPVKAPAETAPILIPAVKATGNPSKAIRTMAIPSPAKPESPITGSLLAKYYYSAWESARSKGDNPVSNSVLISVRQHCSRFEEKEPNGLMDMTNAKAWGWLQSVREKHGLKHKPLDEEIKPAPVASKEQIEQVKNWLELGLTEDDIRMDLQGYHKLDIPTANVAIIEGTRLYREGLKARGYTQAVELAEKKAGI